MIAFILSIFALVVHGLKKLGNCKSCFSPIKLLFFPYIFDWYVSTCLSFMLAMLFRVCNEKFVLLDSLM